MALLFGLGLRTDFFFKLQTNYQEFRKRVIFDFMQFKVKSRYKKLFY